MLLFVVAYKVCDCFVFLPGLVMLLFVVSYKVRVCLCFDLFRDVIVCCFHKVHVWIVF